MPTGVRSKCDAKLQFLLTSSVERSNQADELAGQFSTPSNLRLGVASNILSLLARWRGHRPRHFARRNKKFIKTPWLICFTLSTIIHKRQRLRRERWAESDCVSVFLSSENLTTRSMRLIAAVERKKIRISLGGSKGVGLGWVGGCGCSTGVHGHLCSPKSLRALLHVVGMLRFMFLA